MEEIEKINIINKRLRQKEARADWKWFKNIHHKILFHIPLTEEESNSLEFHYKWREQTHMIQALINDIRSKL
jgi:hypothetical protein